MEWLANFDWVMVAASFGIGIIVGLTGMGGGALMTPMMVLFFGVSPLAAVSSDLVASAVMKPVGSAVHLRHGTVHLGLVKWLTIGSVPAAFAGVLIIRALGEGEQVQSAVKVALGVALLVAASGLVLRAYLRVVERAKVRDGRLGPEPKGPPAVRVRPVPTLIVGVVGGLIVGMTSVGSGSLIIIALMLLYPGLKAGELVGTDLVQAVPLVISAAIGHVIFGDFQFALTGALLLGSVPGVFIGAQLSTRAPGGLVRRALAFVLTASALKLLDVPNQTIGIILVALLVLAPPIWMVVRRAHGLPMTWRAEQARAAGERAAAEAPEPPSQAQQGSPARPPA